MSSNSTSNPATFTAKEGRFGCTTCAAAVVLYAEWAALPPRQKSNISELAAQTDAMWGLQHRISISFWGGKSETKEKVMSLANEWVEPGVGAGIEWIAAPDNDKTADIRVLIRNIPEENDRIWQSKLGRNSQDNGDDPSMTLDIDHPDCTEEELRRHVLHEFGHALGFIHEHLRPDFQTKFPIISSKEKLLELYKPWDWDTIQWNVLGQPPLAGITTYGTPDENSIMIYSFKEGVLQGDKTIGWNTHLSAEDLKYAREAYPSALKIEMIGDALDQS